MDTKILEQLEGFLAEEITLTGNDLASLEILLKEKLQLLGKGLLQRLVDRGADPGVGGAVREVGTGGGGVASAARRRHGDNDVDAECGRLEIRHVRRVRGE